MPKLRGPTFPSMIHDDSHDASARRADFDHLTPDLAIGLAEEALGVRCTNLCRPMNSYINRVYEIEREDGDKVIAKFYRPARWSRDALAEEHAFLLELADEELPVIAPLRGAGGETLFAEGDMYFALFEKKGGRICDEPRQEEWLQLGRLIGRVHQVGADRDAHHRIVLAPDAATREQVEYILASGLVAPEHERAYEDITTRLIDRIAPLFDRDEFIRIHGDCHHQNIIHRPDEGFYMIDFDDMAMGPPIQDVWMLLPGRVADARHELNLFLEGYETFRPLPPGQRKLVEPLRAMRFIHFTAWCVRQAADGGFSRLAPDWGTSAWWRQEVHELQKQMTEIDDAG